MPKIKLVFLFYLFFFPSLMVLADKEIKINRASPSIEDVQGICNCGDKECYFCPIPLPGVQTYFWEDKNLSIGANITKEQLLNKLEERLAEFKKSFAALKKFLSLKNISEKDYSLEINYVFNNALDYSSRFINEIPAIKIPEAERVKAICTQDGNGTLGKITLRLYSQIGDKFLLLYKSIDEKKFPQIEKYREKCLLIKDNQERDSCYSRLVKEDKNIQKELMVIEKELIANVVIQARK